MSQAQKIRQFSQWFQDQVQFFCLAWGTEASLSLLLLSSYIYMYIYFTGFKSILNISFQKAPSFCPGALSNGGKDQISGKQTNHLSYLLIFSGL